MIKLACAVLLALPAAASAQYVLRPTAEIDNGYTVSVDRQPSQPLGRSVAVAAGSVLTVKADNDKAFAAVLIGPSGIMDAVQKGSWSARLVSPGGYRLQFGAESAIFPMQSVVDFVVVADPAAAMTAGTQNADALYEP